MPRTRPENADAHQFDLEGRRRFSVLAAVFSVTPFGITLIGFDYLEQTQRFYVGESGFDAFQTRQYPSYAVPSSPLDRFGRRRNITLSPRERIAFAVDATLRFVVRA